MKDPKLMTTADLKRIRKAIMKKNPIPPKDLEFLKRIERVLQEEESYN